MFMLATALFLSLILLSGGPHKVHGQTSGPVLTDDFNDNFLDPVIWRAEIPEPQFTQITEVNNRIEITQVPGSLNGGVMRSLCIVSSDFDVQVDYSLLVWPLFGIGNGVRVGLGFAPGFLVERVSLSSFFPDFLGSPSREVYLTDLGASLAGDPNPIFASMVATTDLSGTLRLVRTGTNLTGFFFDTSTNQFVPLQTITNAPTSDIQIAFNAFPPGSLPSEVGEVKVAFDNFVLNAGTLLCPPPQAKVLKEKAVAELNTVKATIQAGATGVGDVADAVLNLNDAIAFLQNSLTSFQPSDPNRLIIVLPEGTAFFDDEENAVEEIFDAIDRGVITNPSILADLENIVVNKILEADGIVAQTAIDDANATPSANQEDIADALAEQAKAQDQVADGVTAGISALLFFDDAVGSFEDAWENAQKAVGALP